MRIICIFILFSASLAVTAGEEPNPFVRPAEWARPIMNASLKNFYQVDHRLFRSAQPDKDDTIALQKLGIQSVLNLRQYHDDKDELPTDQFRLMRVAMNAGDVTEAQITEALRKILTSKGPVLVHCWHGSDRTGAVVAAYRMVVMNWTKENAIKEFKSGGYGFHKQFYSNLETLLRQLNVEQIQKALIPDNTEAILKLHAGD